MKKKDSIVQELQSRISTGVLTPGARLPSERDLAVEFESSRATIQEALKELEFRGLLDRKPNHRPVVQSSFAVSRIKRTKTADQIAIWILPDRQDSGGTMMLQGIRAGFSKRSCRLLIACPPSYDREEIDRAEIEFLSGLLTNPDIAGAIVWDSGNLGCAPVYRALVEAKLPLVFIDREPPYDIDADMVGCNNRRAARNAVCHLVDLGHRQIAMVIGTDHASSVTERIEGFELALRQAEIELHSHRIVELRLDLAGDPIIEAERVLRDLLAQPDGPTALFVVNDRLALYMLEAAKNLGVEVPGQLSIVGFDWLLRWLPSGGDITTVAQPFDEIGRAAAKRVLDRIGGDGSESARHILFEAPLIIRNSTGPPAAEPYAAGDSCVIGDHHAKTKRVHSY